jgi:putative ATP-dependent endonuclease of OLD family
MIFTEAILGPRIGFAFAGDDPRRHTEWFREGRAVPKWWDADTLEAKAEQENEHSQLCAQIGFVARFDLDTLTVETARYFHDDDAPTDPFQLDVLVSLPRSVVADLGVFLVPVSRTWDRQLSFGSELFRRLVTSAAGLPSSELLAERDRLRTPSDPIEQTASFGAIVSRIDAELARVFPERPHFNLRVTSTDTEALLNALVPHYQIGESPALPAARQGTGLMSVQTLLVLLELGRIRHDQDQNFILVIEEPEIHVPPGIQKRLVYRSQAVSDQTIVTSHSPNIVAFYPSTAVKLLRNRDGRLTAVPLLEKPLDNSASNGIRKLFYDSQQELIEALMQEYVMIPEGRTDHYWFKLLVRATETKESWDISDESPFGASIGVVPTHEAAILPTYAQLRPLSTNLVILVDGDADGDRYIEGILGRPEHPRLIVQWPTDWTIESVVAWILVASQSAINHAGEVLGGECGSLESLTSRLRSREIKQNYLLHEDIAQIISSDATCLRRAKEVLSDLHSVIGEPWSEGCQFTIDARSGSGCLVRKWIVR